MVRVISEHSFICRFCFLKCAVHCFPYADRSRSFDKAVNNCLIAFSYKSPILNVASVVDVNHTACFRLVSLKSIVGIVYSVGYMPYTVAVSKFLRNGLFGSCCYTVCRIAACVTTGFNTLNRICVVAKILYVEKILTVVLAKNSPAQIVCSREIHCNLSFLLETVLGAYDIIIAVFNLAHGMILLVEVLNCFSKFCNHSVYFFVGSFCLVIHFTCFVDNVVKLCGIAKVIAGVRTYLRIFHNACCVGNGFVEFGEIRNGSFFNLLYVPNTVHGMIVVVRRNAITSVSIPKVTVITCIELEYVAVLVLESVVGLACSCHLNKSPVVSGGI